MAKKVSTTIYITQEQQSLLKDLNERSRVPVAEFIRQGIDLVLQKNRHMLPGQMDLGDLPQGESKMASESSRAESSN